MGSVPEEFEREALLGAQTNKSKLVVKNLSNAFKSAGACEEFYDVVGKVVKMNASLFMDCYGDLEGKLKKITPDQLTEMDKHILKHQVLLSGEEVKTSFYGTLTQKGGLAVYGRIYLTDYRLIAIGPKAEGKVDTYGMARIGGIVGGRIGAIAGAIAGSSLNYRLKAIRNGIKKAVHQEFSDSDFVEYGYMYPIIGAYEQISKKGTISYKVDLEYEKKGKTKQTTLSLSVSPAKEKGESKGDFNKRNEDISNIFLETLKK
ncbi:MAG: hypothetical protein ACFFHV_09740 [Promethearchaeota archaeon]